MNRFAGRSALVIGASTGIGLAAAERLASEGARVGVADVDPVAAADAAARLPGDGHLGLGIDVREADSVEAAVAAFAPDGSAIDALLHVAGGDARHGAFEDTGDDVWRAMLELNLLGAVRTIRAALPGLRRSTAGPAIVVVGSVNALATAGSPPYSAAKAGLSPLVGNLAADLGPDGIRVNAVAPGTVRTRVWDDQGGPDRLADRYPLGRVGEPEDVAAAIAFLASSDAAWITGHVLPVDGGLLARRAI